MMLELHNVTIGQLIRELSLTVNEGRMVCVSGPQGSGKTTLLRAVLGFLPIDDGFISIDGELLTPQSAPYFRRQMAYVPQQLSLPEGSTEVQTDYLWLLNRAIESGKQLLIIDEPQSHLSSEEYWEVDRLLMDAARKGMTILAVNDRITQNQIQL